MPAEDPLTDLMTLSKAAVVAILTPNRPRELLGTGFYITPNQVLTCAHVVADFPRVHIWSSATGAAVRGTVQIMEPAQGGQDGPHPWKLPDLALIGVPPRTDLAPGCVAWLELGTDYQIARPRNALFTVGYDHVGLGKAPTVGRRDFIVTGDRSPDGQVDAAEISNNNVPKYRSGSPVVDTATGRVVGVMKAARAPGDGNGGYVPPLARWLPLALGAQTDEVLGAHDRFHARQPDWPEACSRLGTLPSPATVAGHPLLEVTLLDLIADVRTVLTEGEQAEFLEPLVADRLLRRGGSLREAALVLAGLGTESAVAPHRLLIFVDRLATRTGQLAGTQWSRRTENWLTACAATLGQTTRLRSHRQEMAGSAKPDHPPDVLPSMLRVHVQPTFDLGGGYDISVRLHNAAYLPSSELCWQAGSVGRTTVWPQLKEQLPRIIMGLPRRESTMLDLIVPLDLLDEPVHVWALPGLGAIGEVLPVIIRAQERWQEEGYAASRDALRAAWSCAASAPVPVTWVMCDGTVVDEPVPDADGKSCGRVALGLTNPPTSRHPWPRRLLREALEDGLPLVVWSVGDCGVVHGTDGTATRPCAGPLFRDRFLSAMNGTRLLDLPRKLFELRSRREWYAEDVVLFWDNPDHAYAEPPLEEPGYPEVA